MLEVGFDESGNSGENLLDPAQPIYTLASVARPESEVAGQVAELLADSPYSSSSFPSCAEAEQGGRSSPRSSSQACSILRAPA